VSTLIRRLTSISKAHHQGGFANPAGSPMVRATLHGIKRRHGSVQTQAKPLLKDDLFAALAATDDTVRAVRDRALLLVGFAGGFRRSELVALDREDVESVRRGIIVHVRRSKTDQTGKGRQVAIPFGRSQWCPVSAIEKWLASAGIDAGPLFRPIDRRGRVADTRLSGEAVSLIVKERVARAGLDPTGFSGHSLRAGLVTSATLAGVPAAKIRQQTGHKSDLALTRYIRDGQLFIENAAGVLL
jgi:integrase